MTHSLEKLSYQILQQSKSYFSVAHKALSIQAKQWLAPAPTPNHDAEAMTIPPQTVRQMQARLNELIEVDWQDAEQGIYPTTLLFDAPWLEYGSVYPYVWLDQPGFWERSDQKRFQDFAPDIDTQGYPKYYLRNFHYQTDGYLSERSADLYDLQVEILFSGAADAMRRRVLAPLKQGLMTQFQTASGRWQLLDVACGTGRTLQMLRGTFAKASLYGIDLSPTYLAKANQRLSLQPGVLPQLIQARGEALPYKDNYFHGVTCVFLFHELPGPVRQQVINESFRVTQPGGTFVICDSIQKQDSSVLQPLLELFPVVYHEPFYWDYIQDDLTQRLTQAGFINISTQNHFASKYWVAQKPA